MVIAAVGALLACARPVAAQQTGESVVVDRASPDDLYLAGGEVDVRAPVAGDLVAAARTLRVDGDVSGDALLAGDDVTVRGAIGDDVRAAGRAVRIAGPIAGHLVAAGDTVVIASGQRVEQFAWIAGRQIEVLGSVGSLRATGESVTIDGEVRGDADVAASTIRLAPGAIVHGDLRWSGRSQPLLAQGARVEGQVVGAPTVARDTTGATVIGIVVWITSLILAALLLALATPSWSATVAHTARSATWRSLAAGLAVLLVTPIAIALSFVSGVLWIVGVVLLVGYLLALVTGTLFGVLALADLALDVVGRKNVPRSRGQRLGAIVAAAIAVGLLALVPILGAIVLFLLTVVGIGSSAVALVRGRRRPTLAPPLARQPVQPAPA